MNNRNEIAELLDEALEAASNGCAGNAGRLIQKAQSALAALQAGPVGKLVDSGFRQIEWYNKPPVDSLLYTSLQPAKVPEWFMAKMDQHALSAGECPPRIKVVPLYSIRRLASTAAPAATQPAKVPEKRHPVGGLDYGWRGEYNRGWNDCIDAVAAALQAEPVEIIVTDEMAFAFHRALTDGDLPASDVEEIKTGLRAALANVASPQPAQVPEYHVIVDRQQLELAIRRAEIFDDGGDGADGESARSVVSLLRSMLTAAPAEPAKVPEWQRFLDAVRRELHREDRKGNAPGHGHSVHGIWDSDNGELAGKECAWCLAWNMAKTALTAPAAGEGEHKSNCKQCGDFGSECSVCGTPTPPTEEKPR